MTPSESVEGALAALKAACDAVAKCKRHKQALTGSGFYGKKFHECQIELRQLKAAFASACDQAGISADLRSSLVAQFELIEGVTASVTERKSALRSLTLECRGVLLPRLAANGEPAEPRSAHLCPPQVVAKTRGYIESVARQANGCYEQGWWDACSVMLRRLVETLLIEVYEHHGWEARIKDPNGHYLALGDMISVVSADTALKLSSESRKTLPKVKQLGDRSAHNRRFVAKQPDVDAVAGGLRVLVADLVGLGKW